MSDDLQLPAKIVKEGEIVRDWRNSVFITINVTVPDGFRESMAELDARLKERKRRGKGVVRDMMPWDDRDADITI